ncbi:hypothetical protein [Sabulicella glaciei]|uniref:Lipoprotein n=1 Tax=Sabulicella glaciei TaxID=2984948 RepID=A0ABT3NX24_9PROT|nr:hypothetical protein [Roseococcus sp. MDT2-1-1]MCW8086706.1 hypothetical protein [Roseococcus sp. MDT2-1-1]
MTLRLLPTLALLAACSPVVVVQPIDIRIPACDGRFQVVNVSGATVRSLVVRTPGGGERDVLGLGNLPPGTELTVAAPPGPNLVRAILASGQEMALGGFDPCRAEILRVTPVGLRPQ